ncbi:uncharacterized protein LOC119580586 [Penaeus monodon]|uniref:uncharacterized protein LOC119580586 n=1 Tax=Penaeus monodon TaxID=6687 RepID=UPI0018A7B007|nr:uncharacterized protein LOC119580586 [Penaeus monodon]
MAPVPSTSMEDRMRVVLHEEGYSCDEIAERMKVARSTVQEKLEWSDSEEKTSGEWFKVGPRRSHCDSKVKHGGGGAMVWGCITSRGVGRLYKVSGTVNTEYYIKIIKYCAVQSLIHYFEDCEATYKLSRTFTKASRL